MSEPNPTSPIPTPPKPAHRIGIVTCSTRPQRIGPLITTHILNTLRTTLPNSTLANPIDWIEIDLANPLSPPSLNTTLLSLHPHSQEPLIPATLPQTNPTPHYTHPSTRAWSSLISSLDAIILITSQHNHSFPAPLKHLIDLLYHEWAGLPTTIVSYGGHGGGRARLALEAVLGRACHAQVVGAQAQEEKGSSGGAAELTVPVTMGMECIEKGALDAGLVRLWEGERGEGGMGKAVENVRRVIGIVEEGGKERARAEHAKERGKGRH